ncbi:hypothetical protein WDW37_06795 [Bdellovibrionota bacterium FG-1]
MIPEKKIRKNRIKADLSVFDEELTAKFNPRDFIPDAPVHARVIETKAAPVPIITPPAEAKPLVSTRSFTIEPAEMVLSLVEENKENGTSKVRFYNPTSRDLCAVLHTPLRPTHAWLLTLSGKRLQPILFAKDSPLSVSVKASSLVTLELAFANC